jgi:hypothetical protein
MRQVWQTEGTRALWRGSLARVLWLAPGCGITMTVFQAVTSALRVDEKPAAL